jgi:hypothetical protein
VLFSVHSRALELWEQLPSAATAAVSEPAAPPAPSSTGAAASSSQPSCPADARFDRKPEAIGPELFYQALLAGPEDVLSVLLEVENNGRPVPPTLRAWLQDLCPLTGRKQSWLAADELACKALLLDFTLCTCASALQPLLHLRVWQHVRCA